MTKKMKKELLAYIRERISEDKIAQAWDEIDKWRCPLSQADSHLYDEIESIVEDFCYDYDIDRREDDWEDYEAEYLFREL